MAIEGYLTGADDLHKLSSVVCDHFESSNAALKYKITDCGKRSIPQNSTFHGWCGEAAKYLAKNMPNLVWEGVRMADMKPKQSLEAVKDMLKHTHLGYQEKSRHNVVTGEIKITEELRKTSDLDKGEMFKFMNDCEMTLTGWGIPITIPVSSEYRELMDRQND